MLSENDCMRLVYVLGRFLAYLPLDQILTFVDEIFAPGLAQLQSIAAVEVSCDNRNIIQVGRELDDA